MAGYKVEISEELSKALLSVNNRVSFDKAFEKLKEDISESPRSRGGILYSGQNWTYGVMVYKIKAIIDDENKTVKLINMFRLP